MRRSRQRGARILRRVVALKIVLAIAYVLWLRPRWMRWGATDDEVAAWLPGDELGRPAMSTSTRALTIDAPPDAVWPWLAQIGWGRAAFYSYNWIENLMAGDLHNADEIHPEWQDLAVGDRVRLARPFQGRLGDMSSQRVALLDPGKALVLQEWSDDPVGAWSFVLRPTPEGGTRLLVRSRSGRAGSSMEMPFIFAIFEPLHFLMERGMMLGLKQRAER